MPVQGSPYHPPQVAPCAFTQCPGDADVPVDSIHQGTVSNSLILAQAICGGRHTGLNTVKTVRTGHDGTQGAGPTTMDIRINEIETVPAEATMSGDSVQWDRGTAGGQD